MIDKLKSEMLKVASDLNSNRLTYKVNFWFGCSESVKIGEVEINQNPKYVFFGSGNGISEKDLLEMERDGFIKKVSEVINEHDPLEKTIEYEIVKVV